VVLLFLRNQIKDWSTEDGQSVDAVVKQLLCQDRKYERCENIRTSSIRTRGTTDGFELKWTKEMTIGKR
jgi:hypothetical protein